MRSLRCSEQHAVDLMVVIGGYNSSNTCNLARICAERVPTYHIADPAGLVSADEIRHKPVGSLRETTCRRLAPGRAVHDRADVRRLDAGQPGGSRDSPARRAGATPRDSPRPLTELHVTHV